MAFEQKIVAEGYNARAFLAKEYIHKDSTFWLYVLIKDYPCIPMKTSQRLGSDFQCSSESGWSFVSFYAWFTILEATMYEEDNSQERFPKMRYINPDEHLNTWSKIYN